MSNRSNFTCWVCGKQYHYCPHCEAIASWKAIACTPRHYQIHMILSEYREGVYNKEEAKAAFEHIGICEEDYDTLLESVTRDIKLIMEDKDNKSSKTTRARNKK